MTIGYLRIELFVSDANNLKDKRGVIKGLLDSVRRRFNVSAIEESNDKWQQATIGIACVGLNKAECNCTLDKLLEFINGNPRVKVLDYSLELF